MGSFNLDITGIHLFKPPHVINRLHIEHVIIALKIKSVSKTNNRKTEDCGIKGYMYPRTHSFPLQCPSASNGFQSLSVY